MIYHAKIPRSVTVEQQNMGLWKIGLLFNTLGAYMDEPLIKVAVYYK